jgi:hypothetical protein
MGVNAKRRKIEKLIFSGYLLAVGVTLFFIIGVTEPGTRTSHVMLAALAFQLTPLFILGVFHMVFSWWTWINE